MRMRMIVAVVVCMERSPRQAWALQNASSRQEAVAVAAAGAVFEAAADALDVMVVALLGEADFGLEAEHLLAIFAQ